MGAIVLIDATNENATTHPKINRSTVSLFLTLERQIESRGAGVGFWFLNFNKIIIDRCLIASG
jgi:hypothetical protein